MINNLQKLERTLVNLKHSYNTVLKMVSSNAGNARAGASDFFYICSAIEKVEKLIEEEKKNIKPAPVKEVIKPTADK